MADDNGRKAYDFPRKQGLDPFDKTAFLASQKAWRGDDKEYWNTIADNILNHFEPNGYQDPEYDVPLMRFQDKVVLDHDNNPVRLFRDLPLTLSSAVEPWLLEAFTRIDSRINKVDIRARMPATFTDQRGRPQTVIRLAGLGNRTMRFREMYGLIPWTPRTGSKVWKQKVLSVMTEEQIANNTTEGLGKFPTKKPNNQSYVDVDPRHSGAAEDSYAPMETCQEPSNSSPAPPIRMDAHLMMQRQYIEAMQAADKTHPSNSSPAPLIRMSDAQLILQRQYIEAMQAADRTHAALNQ